MTVCENCGHQHQDIVDGPCFHQTEKKNKFVDFCQCESDIATKTYELEFRVKFFTGGSSKQSAINKCIERLSQLVDEESAELIKK